VRSSRPNVGAGKHGSHLPYPHNSGISGTVGDLGGVGVEAQNSPVPAETRTPGATRKSVRTEAGASRGHCRSSGAHPSSQGRQCARRQPDDSHRAETRRRQGGCGKDRAVDGASKANAA
jgi:hypothetical protein